jgi:hypothetical protein
VLCFSAEALGQVRLQAQHPAGIDCVQLHLTLGSEPGRALEILFPHEQADLALEWASALARLAGRNAAVAGLGR